MSFVGSNILAGASGQGGGYKERSIRFNASDSSYLSRTPSSAGNRKTWTWSAWLKRSGIGANDNLFKVAGSSSKATQFSIMIHNGDYVSIDYGGAFYLRSTRLLRDPSAWQHWVVSVDTTNSTANNRIRLYINKVEETAFDTRNNPDQNEDLGINRASEHTISSNDSSGLDGYLADVHFIDGQALAPTDFGETDTNGVWQPKEYSGTYGTNGFHLDFKDNSSNAALGNDAAGSNTWTVNNLSVAAGAGNDSLRDSPSQIADQTDSGAGGTVVGNYAVMNPLQKDSGVTLSNGNLDLQSTTNAWKTTLATVGMKTGKFYCEFGPYLWNSNSAHCQPGISPITQGSLGEMGGINGSAFYHYSGTKFFNGQGGAGSSFGSAWNDSQTNIIGIAYDADTRKVWFSRNGVWQGSGDPANGTNEAGILNLIGDGTYAFTLGVYGGLASPAVTNFGQRAFAHAAPTNFKCLNTASLSPPTIADGSKYFDVNIWSGNSTSRNIATTLSPSFVWIKGRSHATNNVLYDAVRGPTKVIYADTTSAEATQSTQLTAFNSNSFSLAAGNEVNQTGRTYVGWAWDAGSSTTPIAAGSISSGVPSIASTVRAKPSAGISIVEATAGGSYGMMSIGHGLNDKPSIVITKRRNGTGDWLVHTDVTGSIQQLELNKTDSAVAGGSYYSANSTTFSLYHGHYTDNNHELINYCFAPVEGYSAMGSYTGNGSSDGPFVHTGFRPAFVLVKSSTNTEHWVIWDTSRSTFNQADDILRPNTSATELSNYSGGEVDILSNGFKLRGTWGATNGSGQTYLYLAFASHPFKTARAR